LETFQAIYRSAFNRFEGDFGFNSTFGTDSFEHFPRTSVAAAAAAILSAIFTAFGFILKPFLMIKFLFSSGKYELLSTVLAY
jgi:hypothetical protein